MLVMSIYISTLLFMINLTSKTEHFCHFSQDRHYIPMYFGHNDCINIIKNYKNM